MNTVSDCNLNGRVIRLAEWSLLSSEQLAEVVGDQEPGGELEHAHDYCWRYASVPLDGLKHVNEDGESPEGGWSAAHERNMCSDREAVAGGSACYVGRDKWLRDYWCKNPAIYPIFLVEQDGGYRLWDGYRRLAGAHFYKTPQVAALVGSKRVGVR